MNRMPAAVAMNVASGSSATLRALTPDPEVPARVQHRQFTAEYRRRFLTEADACQKPGALGALLRREGLYSSHLANWRRQREQGELLESVEADMPALGAATSECRGLPQVRGHVAFLGPQRRPNRLNRFRDPDALRVGLRRAADAAAGHLRRRRTLPLAAGIPCTFCWPHGGGAPAASSG